MKDKIIEAPFTSEESLMTKCISKLERYGKVEQIISEYKRQPSENVFTNDKYFRKILEVFEVD